MHDLRQRHETKEEIVGQLAQYLSITRQLHNLFQRMIIVLPGSGLNDFPPKDVILGRNNQYGRGSLKIEAFVYDLYVYLSSSKKYI